MSSQLVGSRLRRVLTLAVAAAVLATTGFLAWAASAMLAEARPLAMATSDSGFTLTETADAVVLTPADPTPTGLVYLAGARVEPAAYAYKLAGLAEAGVTVVIVRPTLNFAIFEGRPLGALEALAPQATHWFVGGHSLGGVRACSYAAANPDAVAGLILFGSYCADDVSGSSLPVLTIVGERDGLSTPANVADAAHLLPPDAAVVTLPGATHAQFGDYGLQPGDGTSTTTDQAVRRGITDAVSAFIDGVDGH
ncbi:MAG: alpha/beta hydrolase [Pseudolysinimonas sp.]